MQEIVTKKNPHHLKEINCDKFPLKTYVVDSS